MCFTLLTLIAQNMGLDNKEWIVSNTSEPEKYPKILQNNIIYMLFKGIVIEPGTIWPLYTFLEKKKFSKEDSHEFENLRENLKGTYEETRFIWMDTNIIIKIIDKLYEYYTEYKKLRLNDINELKNSTEYNDPELIWVYIQGTRKSEEYLIEMLQMKHVLVSWVEDNKIIKIDVGLQLNIQSRAEKLMLDYFWSFERQSKYLDELEKEYHDNLVKNDELFREKEKKSYTNLETLEKEVEHLKRDRYMIKEIKIDMAKIWLKRHKDEIYRLVEKFGIRLSGDLCSKLWKYPEFSDLLVENDRRISTAQEAEIIEIE